MILFSYSNEDTKDGEEEEVRQRGMANYCPRAKPALAHWTRHNTYNWAGDVWWAVLPPSMKGEA